jgi:hypothetical protein
MSAYLVVSKGIQVEISAFHDRFLLFEIEYENGTAMKRE